MTSHHRREHDGAGGHNAHHAHDHGGRGYSGHDYDYGRVGDDHGALSY